MMSSTSHVRGLLLSPLIPLPSALCPHPSTRGILRWPNIGVKVNKTARMRVLVVEDEQKVASALREGLEGEGYDVIVEHTGEGAFFRLNTERFDIILLDVMLP